MKKVLLAQTVLLVIGSVLSALIFGKNSAVSFALGAGLILLNFKLLSWSWAKVIFKKSVAIAFMVIVFKYAILAGIIYGISLVPGIEAVSFAAGLMTVVPASLLATINRRVEGRKNEEH